MKNLDFNQFFVVGVFRSREPSGGYHVEIQRIVQKGDTITMYTHFIEPDPNVAQPATPVSPRHLVKVALNGLHGEFKFVLEVDGQIEQRKTYVLP